MTFCGVNYFFKKDHFNKKHLIENKQPVGKALDDLDETKRKILRRLIVMATDLRILI